MFKSLAKKLHLHKSGALKQCKPGKHVNPVSLSECAHPQCGISTCENCSVVAPNTMTYCMNCFTTKPELQQQMVSVDEEDDDLFDFDSGPVKSTGTFTKVGVQVDKQTGQFVGVDKFYDMVERSGSQVSTGRESAQSAVNVLTQSRSDTAAAFQSANARFVQSTEPTFIVPTEQPLLASRKLLVKNQETGQIDEVSVVKHGNIVTFEGLPEELEGLTENWNNEEKWQNFRAVLECAVALHATISSEGDIRQSIMRASEYVMEEVKAMPTNSEFQNQSDTAKNSIWKKEDPSAYYDVFSKEKLGVGGFAKVFRVQRKSDKAQFALKFCQPNTDEDRELMFNEVALMQMCCGQNGFCLNVIEAYDDDRGFLWIFVELMDGAVTGIIKSMRGREEFYTEKALKWCLRQTLRGLHYLHSQNIVHRDIKSDNILTNVQGEVKLADFGYSAQLTQERSARSSKVGTLCWMAPELIKGERRYDTKIDIWSFGIFAFELAEGDPPYIREPQSRVMINIITRDPPPQISTRWSEPFRDFVKQCLTVDVEQRPSAEQLLAHPWLEGSSLCKGEYALMVDTYVTETKAAKAQKKADAKAQRRAERQAEKEKYKQEQQANLSASQKK